MAVLLPTTPKFSSPMPLPCWAAAAMVLMLAACGSPRPSGPEYPPYRPPSAEEEDDNAGESPGDNDDDDASPAEATDSATGASQDTDAGQEPPDPSDDLLANGENCDDSNECQSGYCSIALIGAVCSDCTDSADCPIVGQDCVFDNTLGYRVCSLGELGDTCLSDAACSDGVCRIRPTDTVGLCSDCRNAQHCRDTGAGINCSNDLAFGYYRCSDGSLGEECYDPVDCASTLCRPEGEEAGYGKCSECLSDEDCRSSGAGLNCTNKVPENLDDPTYYLCGTGQLGEKCETDAACVGERCVAGHCSECKTAQQCRDEGQGRNCVYRSTLRHSGWHRCTEGEIGDVCDVPESCRPELFCAERWTDAACAECGEDADCPAGDVCALPLQGGTRVCIPANSSPTGSYCDLSGPADESCEGYCVALDPSPQAETDPHAWPAIGVGACGSCRPGQNDCLAGEICVPPSYSEALGATGSRCVPSFDG
ncbi:MAG: hypothetical protein B7733_24230 [Myxococcales bacterium FL481]|nr:MAG: hypothetical protein B7733_24230 [Myxococcales bacterium FL481]